MPRPSRLFAAALPFAALGSGLAAAQTAANEPAAIDPTAAYPEAAYREGREGTAHYTFAVAEDGRAENCTIVGSSGWADLDEATCRVVLTRARLKPVLDERGRPRRGAFAGRLVWKIPG